MLPSKFLPLVFLFLLFGTVFCWSAEPQIQVVHPAESQGAFKNPLKGFRVDAGKNCGKHEYATLGRCYIKWNDLENSESDSIEKIREYCDRAWKVADENGVSVIPRVYLDWDKKEGNEFWPSDLQTGDYTSEKFQARLKRLIERLGEVWNDDPRVAWIQMGFIGYWGEHHSPSPSPEVEKLLGETFTKAFPNKKVLVRHADEFQDFEFGIYWDSWAHSQQMEGKKHGGGLLKLNQEKARWKVTPIEGETAYNWGKYQIQPGDDPNDTLSDPVHLDYLLDSIRLLHCTALGWVSAYNPSVPGVKEGAAEVQKAFGYRFVVREFAFPKTISAGQNTELKLSVQNVGSAPFYADWPLAMALLDPQTNEPVWQTRLDGVDVRKWFPGDDWDREANAYRTPAEIYVSTLSFEAPKLPKGEYTVVLGILNPETGKPAVRFANEGTLVSRWQPMVSVKVK